MIETNSTGTAFRKIPLDFIDDQSLLIQALAWCYQKTRHYLNQCSAPSVSLHNVTRSQQFNIITRINFEPTWLYGHGNGQDWVDGRITGVHTYPWPTCGPQTVHTRYTIVRLIRIEILSVALSYISRAWLEVDLSLWIPHSISLLIIVQFDSH